MFIRFSLGIALGISLVTASAPGQQAPSGATAGGNAASVQGSMKVGQAVFAQHCAKCHGADGGGRNGVVSIAGPSLKAEHDRGTVMTAVDVGPSHMPSFVYVLSVPEIHSVSDYVTQQIATIPLQGGDLGQGGELFRENCATCHRTAARGGALAFVGTNAPDLVNKSPALIAGAIRWGPGPMPAFPPFVLNDEQVASITKYVQFVQRPPDPGGSALGYYGPVAEGFVGWVGVFLLIAVTGWIEKGGKG